MSRPAKRTVFPEQTLTYLRALGHRYPTVEAAIREIASLEAILRLPMGTIHIVSDVHGEFKKLKHIINNASGSLRPLVDRCFGESLSEQQKRDLVNLIYYPRETYTHLGLKDADRRKRKIFLRKSVRQMQQILRKLVWGYSLKTVDRIFPEDYRLVLRELLFEPQFGRGETYCDAMLDQYVEHGRDLEFLRTVTHTIRNLLVYELIVAGDLGDRGPRIDKVIDYLMRQPNVSFTWGNHDVSWMGACLGQEACIATVLRISLRYRRLSQLEEGYGIPAAPIELLARTCYADDPASRFACKGEGLRDAKLMARMQKAMAVIQFKLEGQTIERNPHFDLGHRNLLHRIDPNRGTVTIDGIEHPMLDMHFPTIDWNDPYKLSKEEAACMERLKKSFLESPVLWRQMKFVEQRGSVYLRRDRALIFHGCVPVDERGKMLSFKIDGVRRSGRELFDALSHVVHRAFRTRNPHDIDMLWYLWTGALSPMFGKDRMATFETYFVEDKKTHKETKNPYFKLIHDQKFCTKILREFGVEPEGGLIVNGHVPVKLEQGESPLKQSGCAVTIDGAFSEAYGDKGYTLVLDSMRTFLAQHHHFESVSDAITQGADIIPTIQEIAVHDRMRLVGDTEKGAVIAKEIETLKLLVRAYEENILLEQ